MIGLLLSLTAAWADGIHTGIPVVGVPGLGAPRFEGAELGWSAPLPGPDGRPEGLVRVYVGPTVASASTWLADSARAVQRPLSSVPGLGDQAWSAGDQLLLVQDGNVAFQVQITQADRGPALALAQTLLDAVVDGDRPWPAAPALRQVQGLWVLESAQAVGWQVIGGRQPLGEQGFIELPEQVVTWDAWGRFAVLQP